MSVVRCKDPLKRREIENMEYVWVGAKRGYSGLRSIRIDFHKCNVITLFCTTVPY